MKNKPTGRTIGQDFPLIFNEYISEMFFGISDNKLNRAEMEVYGR